MDISKHQRPVHDSLHDSASWVAIGLVTVCVLAIVVSIGLEGQMAGTVAGIITVASVLVSVTVGLIYVYLVTRHISGRSRR